MSVNDNLRGRPRRLTLPDFAGRIRTLPDEASAWDCVKKPARPSCFVLLGVGPGNPAQLPFVKDALQRGLPVCWLDSGEMLPHVQRNFFSWPEIAREQAAVLARNAEIYFYRPGLALAPDFWGPMLADVELSGYRAKNHTSGLSAWLPGANNLLMHQELAFSLRDLGFETVFQNMPEKPDLASLDRLWEGRKPDFALSVNFRGLDPQGRVFELCEKLRIPLAIWLVDNPWNLLAALPLPWWRRASLFVTDPGFIGPLVKHGALNARFCPLAWANHMWRPICASPNQITLFVGRSAFPDRQGFFSGQKIPDQLKKKANELLAANILPDYHWWANQEAASPWPGLSGRGAAFGADEFSAINRARWLRAAEPFNLQIIGDAGWKKFFPQLPIFPPVDYYGKLPEFYGDANCVLNVTSLLLPGSLNQRHFDVWAAGGFMLGEYTPGLEIFPKELTDPVSMKCPEELPEKMAWLGHNPQKRLELQTAWRETLKKGHSYADRVQSMLAQTQK